MEAAASLRFIVDVEGWLREKKGEYGCNKVMVVNGGGGFDASGYGGEWCVCL